jgi:MFS family permease
VLLMSLCIGISALGSHHLMHYWWALVVLGAGWNLLFVAGTTLLTTTYHPSERFKAQAVNEFAVFGSQALASVLAGPAIQHLGWKALNLSGVPLLIAMTLSLLALRSAEPLRATPAAEARAKSWNGPGVR